MPVLTRQQQRCLGQARFDPDTPEGLQNLVIWTCLFSFGVRGRGSVRDVRVGELVTTRHPTQDGVVGVVYRELSEKKTHNADTVNRATAKLATANCVEGVIWSPYLYAVLKAYRARLPTCANDKVLRAEGVPENIINGDDMLMKRRLSPAFLKPRDLNKVSSERPEWYCSGVPVGCHTLSNLVPESTKEAGISGWFTGSTGRSSLTTMLSDSNLPESVAMRFTRHVSIKAFKAYQMGLMPNSKQPQ